MRTRLGILFTLSTLACGGGGGGEPAGPPTPPPPAAVATVTVDPASATLGVGATQTFTATAKDASGNVLSGRTITWTSANPAIATVSTSGVVTAVAAGGPVTITASSEGKTGSAQVIVLAPVATVNVAPSNSTILTGATVTLTATTLDAAGAVLNGRTIAWGTSNPAIATVSANGVVTGVAAGGPVTITASSEGKTGSAQVTVLAPVASVVVGPATSTLRPGNTVTLTATVLDAANAPLTGRTVTWASSDPAIATVSAAGAVTALAPGGPVTITASSEGKSGTAQVTVIAPVASVAVTPPAASLLPLGTQQLAAVPRDAGNNALSGRAVTWASSNPAIASVSTTGLVTAFTPGTATISATSEGQVGTSTITVLAPVTSVVITGAARVKVGDTYAYTATARIADGTIVSRPLTWVVTDPTRATVTPNGVLVPLQSGAFTLRAIIDGAAWDVTNVAYDWRSFGSGTTLGLALAADNTITNKFGTSEYPDLVVGCTSGQLLLFVDTIHFVTASGGVAYNFDGGTIFSRTWVESSDFSNLIYPSLSNSTTLGFASLVATSRTFGFAFTEFNAGARSMIFRVTGLTPLLNAMLPACVLNNNRVAGSELDAVNALRAAAGRPPVMSAESVARSRLGAVDAVTPRLVAPMGTAAQRPAVRVPR